MWLKDVLALALVHFPRSQKTGVSVRVMREMLHRLVIFLSGTIKKNAGKGPFCRFGVWDVGSSVTKKLLKDALALALVHFPRSQKNRCLCTRDA